MPCSTHVHSNLTMSGAKAAEEGKNESTRISFVAISNISFRTVHPMFHPTFHPPILIFHQSRITARKEIRQGMIGTSSPLVFLFFFFLLVRFLFPFLTRFSPERSFILLHIVVVIVVGQFALLALSQLLPHLVIILIIISAALLLL